MLDFTKVNKKFMAVLLVDGTKILVRMPTKKIFDVLFRLRDAMSVVNDPDTDTDTAQDELDLIYDLTAEIMRNNIAGKPVTSEYLAELFDTEDIQTFYDAYLAFVTGRISADPN